MITPLDIENKKFSKQMMNGYSVEEVDEFLDQLTVDYEKTYKENFDNLIDHDYRNDVSRRLCLCGRICSPCSP